MSEFNQINTFRTAEESADWLQQGKLLAYPTESVWGIGCDAMNEKAVRQILSIKNRPIDKGMIVVTDSVARIESLLTSLPTEQVKTIIQSWSAQNTKSLVNQQATTWLLPLPKNLEMPDWVTGKHDSVAVRVIAHPLVKKLCQQMVSRENPYGFIISTSCNPATLDPAKTLQEAQNYFVTYDEVAFLQGDTLGYSQPSQILNAITSEVVR